jgi:hypothetical protein
VVIDVGDADADNKYSRVVRLYPIGDGSTEEWVPPASLGPADCETTAEPNEYQCVDDTDIGDAGCLRNGGLGSQEFLVLENPLLNLDPNESIPSDAAVFASVFMSRNASGSTTDLMEVRTGISDSAETEAKIQWGKLVSAAKENLTHHVDGAVMARIDPNGNAWTQTTLNAMRFVMERRRGVTADAQVQRVIVQTEVKQPPSPMHNTLTNQNSVANIVCAFHGDSLLEGEAIWSALPPMVRQCDKVYKCTYGGVKAWHLRERYEEQLNGVDDPNTEGRAEAFWCEARKGGSLGDPVDYSFVQIGWNDRELKVIYPTTGFCYDYTDPNSDPLVEGAQHGDPCQLPYGRRDNLGNVSGLGRYCVRGLDYMDPNGCSITPFGPFRGMSPDCRDSAAQTETGEGVGPVQCDHTDPGIFCHKGALNAPGCENGVCVQEISPSYTAGVMRTMVEHVEARNADPNDALEDVRLIFVKFPLSCDKPEWTATCPEVGQRWYGSVRGHYQALAERSPSGWIDMHAILMEKCLNGDHNNCLLDCAHWTQQAEVLFAEAVAGYLQYDPDWVDPNQGFMGGFYGVDPNGRID